MFSRRSHIESEPCTHCTSFSDYVKETRKKLEKEKGKTLPSDEELFIKPTREDCPLDRERLGNYSWSLLHTIAAKYPERPTPEIQQKMQDFFSTFATFYPCEVCAKDFRQEIKMEPPDTKSQHAFSQWLCRIHNKINVKLGKEIFDCTKVNERWKDGWPDGSCEYKTADRKSVV